MSLTKFPPFNDSDLSIVVGSAKYLVYRILNRSNYPLMINQRVRCTRTFLKSTLIVSHHTSVLVDGTAAEARLVHAQHASKYR